ncbi:protein kinase [Microcoleus sp. FACHB-SPT15]|uniref:protein kinase domain-containing protein n=1 Tax=Microcoleus sp. FACHB-SPT15 TaxID=2692830 RepID=UPI00177DFF71|nr:protein kinase [Microcoleus sp. FACHB-SPT15]MBD1805930.1 protein kinase [Microcoleus sp. FACHB-SPT15]
MSNLPDFSRYGYQVIRELGHNHIGGRVTYLARTISEENKQGRQGKQGEIITWACGDSTQADFLDRREVGEVKEVAVVIKQFQFAQFGTSWAEYDAYEQEISMLRQLNHPGIPRYLNSFQTPDGFCMVQEYKNAQSLSKPRHFSPQEIKQIAIAVLEILVYLQSQNPPVIHRDIKPENLLLDEGDYPNSLNVYLVDFGFARVGDGEVAVSSVVKGTLGFMPPEQLFNRQLTQASDVYGLGVTLICLLTGTKSIDIGNLIDANYRLHFQHLVPPFQRGWLNWLSKMVEPRPQERYSSAASALAVLKPLDVNRLPKVRLSRDSLKLSASEFGEKVSQSITVSNPIPETLLAGSWTVAPHPNDPPHTPDGHAWISFQSRRFEGNQVECKVFVDTSRLLASQTYNRQILLRTNTTPDTCAIAIQVQTATLPENQQLNYEFPTLCFVFWFFSWLLCSIGNPNSPLNFFLVPGLVTGLVVIDMVVTNVDANVKGVLSGTTIGVLVGVTFGALVAPTVTLIGAATGAVVGASIWVVITDKLSRLSASWLVAIITLVGIVGSSHKFFMFVAVPIFSGLFTTVWTVGIMLPVVRSVVEHQTARGFSKKDATLAALLCAGLGISLGTVMPVSAIVMSQINGLEPLKIAAVVGILFIAITGTSIPLVNLIFLKRARLIAKYRRSIAHLVKP